MANPSVEQKKKNEYGMYLAIFVGSSIISLLLIVVCLSEIFRNLKISSTAALSCVFVVWIALWAYSKMENVTDDDVSN